MMARTVPAPCAEDFERARNIMNGDTETQVNVVAQLVAENRWLANIVHTATATQADADAAFARGKKEATDTALEIFRK